MEFIETVTGGAGNVIVRSFLRELCCTSSSGPSVYLRQEKVVV